MRYHESYSRELEKIIQKVGQNKELLHEYLIDLLSPAEYKTLALRWQIVKKLKKEFSQRQIAKDLGVSVATITRGSRELLNKQGGFNEVYNKFYKP